MFARGKKIVEQEDHILEFVKLLVIIEKSLLMQEIEAPISSLFEDVHKVASYCSITRLMYQIFTIHTFFF